MWQMGCSEPRPHVSRPDGYCETERWGVCLIRLFGNVERDEDVWCGKGCSVDRVAGTKPVHEARGVPKVDCQRIVQDGPIIDASS